MCGLSTVVTPAGASLTMYREIRSYANSIWDDNNNNNNTGGGSRKTAKPAGPLLCTTVIKSDFCARTIQVALRVVNKYNYNNVSRAGPTLKYFYV